MNLEDVLQALESFGTEQNRKVYRKHGYPEPFFGVSFAKLNELAKRIGRDQELARELWRSGNADAQVLATMVADAARMTAQELDAWARTLRFYTVTDLFSRLAADSPHARERAEEWMRSAEEWVGRAGWLVTARLATESREVSERALADLVPQIEANIHQAKNRVRDAMLAALIAIGLRAGELEKAVLEAAERIGKVEVDHGDTECRTLDVKVDLLKAKKHRQEMARRRAGKGGGKAATQPARRVTAKAAQATKAPNPSKAKAKPASAVKPTQSARKPKVGKKPGKAVSQKAGTKRPSAGGRRKGSRAR